MTERNRDATGKQIREQRRERNAWTRKGLAIQSEAEEMMCKGLLWPCIEGTGMQLIAKALHNVAVSATQ